MLILGDDGHYNGRFPWVTATLVVLNVVTYVAQVFLGPAFTLAYALVPVEFPIVAQAVEVAKRSTVEDGRGRNDGPEIVQTVQDARRPKDHPSSATPVQPNQELSFKHHRPPAVVTLFTYLFLHADIFHLLGNMWFLLVFGRNVECAMNHGLFLVFYLICGITAGLGHAVSDAHSLIPCIGASGAISGIMGAYISIHPFNTIRIWLAMVIMEVPAVIVIGVWFILNYVSAVLSLENTANTDNVAYWAHIGGFGAGFILLWTLILYLRLKRLVTGPRGEPSAPTNAEFETTDAFATFLTVQTVRKMQEQQKEQGS